MHHRRHAGHQRLRLPRPASRLHARPRRFAAGRSRQRRCGQRRSPFALAVSRDPARPVGRHRLVGRHAAGTERRFGARLPAAHAVQPLRLPAARRSSEGELDLARLLVGSEGTLALFTEATLRTVPLPGGRAVVLLAFARLDAALRASQLALPTGPAACELIDRRLLILVRGGDAEAAALVPHNAEAVLLIEYESDTPSRRPGCRRRSGRPALSGRAPGVARASLARPIPRSTAFGGCARRRCRACTGCAADRNRSLTSKTWACRRGAAGLPAPRPGNPAAARDDRVVPGPRLTGPGPYAAVPGPAAAGRRRPAVGHRRGDVRPGAGPGRHGQHPARHRPGPDALGGAAVRPALPGLPRAKSDLRPAPHLQPRQDRRAGPGVSRLAAATVRRSACRCAFPFPIPKQPGTGTGRRTRSANGLRWTIGGDAPPRAPTATAAAAAAPRSRAADVSDLPGHARRGRHAAGQGQPDAPPPRRRAPTRGALVRRGARPSPTCASTARCARIECPAHVNVPRLMLEAKAANVAAARHAPRTTGSWRGRRSFARAGSAFAPLVNLALASRSVRWLLEKLFGVSRRRRLPAFARRSFLRRAERRGWTRKPHSAAAARRLLRGRLRQLQRSANRRGGRRRPAPQRHRGLRAARPARLRHGPAGLRRRRGGPRDGRSTTSASWPTWPARACRSSAPSRPPP